MGSKGEASAITDWIFTACPVAGALLCGVAAGVDGWRGSGEATVALLHLCGGMICGGIAGTLLGIVLAPMLGNLLGDTRASMGSAMAGALGGAILGLLCAGITGGDAVAVPYAATGALAAGLFSLWWGHGA